MKKSIKLNQWLWRWHVIAGLISLPFVLLLSITGTIYLFKDKIEAPAYQAVKEVKIEKEKLSYQKQWEIAKQNTKKKISTFVVPTQENEASEFVAGRFSKKHSFYVNPYNGEVTGDMLASEAPAYSVRKLHGELLAGSFGTKIVELIACWMIVLLLTGLYVWFPRGKFQLKSFFTVDFKAEKRQIWRDLHAVTSFWVSGILLLVLLGGLPWTDVFGDYFKWMQKQTNTGYPVTWSGRTMQSQPQGSVLTLDEMITIAKTQNLEGELSIALPKSPKGVFSVSNGTFDLEKRQKIHFDQYSGKKIAHLHWSDVGVLMKARMWLMAFHQGQFGAWNWYLMFFFGLLLTFASASAIVSYLLRKKKGSWSIPKMPKKFRIDMVVKVIIGLLAILLPLFGLSLLVILLISFFTKQKTKTAIS